MRAFAVPAMTIMAWLLPAATASAWDDQGHELIGAIADSMLGNSKAGLQVHQILGYGLGSAAKWADCVRGVHKDASGFRYDGGGPACSEFESPAEVARMIDYARRNWSNCRRPPPDGCHTRYHFADVAIQRDGYSRSFFGTGNDDIVSALDSAVLVLQFQPAEPPISIRDKKEALLMIAHLVGDLHQPLHVGAVYLRADGSLMDPDKPPNQNPASIEKNNTTRGGTDILIEGRANLHAMWDDVPHDWGRIATRELLAKAEAVPPSKAQVDMLATLWAGDTVRLSNDAFKGLTIGARNDQGKWPATIDNAFLYRTKLENRQRQQIIRGGARLAELLREIWPDE
jgi:S1/P1 Nuclease